MPHVRAGDIIVGHEHAPRTISSHRVTRLADAMRAGADLPPVVIDARNRCVDGAHRIAAAIRVHGNDVAIDVEIREYAAEADFAIACLEANIEHGQPLTTYDMMRGYQRLRDLGVEPEVAANTLRLTVERAEALSIDRTAQGPEGTVVLKATNKHLAGATLTEKQTQSVRRAGGLSATFYVNQVINAIEGETLDYRDGNLMARLGHLSTLLNGIVVEA